LDVRRELEDSEKDYITFEEYTQICRVNGFVKRADQLQLSEYLHDLGVCLHFQADPILKHTVILRPEWGTTAVYKALDTEEVRNNYGRFTHKQLKVIWNEEEYAPMQDELLQLMMRFKLCYRIPGTEDKYIAPQLLEVNTPPYDWDNRANLLMRYDYDFMPKGIITRLIVEMHEFIENQTLVWKSGVILTNGLARAEVTELYHKGEIRIRVSGKHQNSLLTVIRHEIDKINSSYERIRVQKLIPCNCPNCIGDQTPYFYKLDKLHERITYQKETIECGKPPFKNVNVRNLIIGMIDSKLVSENMAWEKGAEALGAKGDARLVELQKASWQVQTLKADDPLQQRMDLFDALSQLPNPQFEKLIFMLREFDLPRENLGSSSAAQGERVPKLLEWAESDLGCGLNQVEQVLNRVREN
jgi:hypothetical protein